MEKYSYSEGAAADPGVSIGFFSKLVHQKHVTSYGEDGADNIQENIVDTYGLIQKKLSSCPNHNFLLVGKVQSGKTSNLELLTALAFDNGYNLLVIYGGYDSSLLKQTTDRFKATFDAIGPISYDNGVPAIYHTDDINPIAGIDDEIMSDLIAYKKPVIFVSMKRPAAMRKINALFKKLDMTGIRAFIIDDEGDQASLNTAKDKIQDASATYLQITKMKALLNDPMYLSVTATPQANIFLNEWSQLRPSTVRLIHPGQGYDGASLFHLSDNGIVQLVKDDDSDCLVAGHLAESLANAIKYFIVASAIKRKKATKPDERFSDMIIHASREVAQHSAVYTVTESYISSMRSSFDALDDDVVTYYNELESCYDNNLSGDLKNAFPFSGIKDEIATVIKKIKVVLKNGIGKATQGNEQLMWHKIYIGGDLLQRGLTFKNLITTYFTRWPKGIGNMDTNLQRARWFGYREKYIDLCKIFTTEDIAKEFSNLAEIEEDLWDQFSDVESGALSLDDILIKSDNTKQNPTSKQRVDYKRVKFKNRWIKQRLLVQDEAKILANNSFLEGLFSHVQWNETSAGSKVGHTTGRFAFFTAAALQDLVLHINDVFDCEPFQKKALSGLLNEDGIPVILMGSDIKPRKRSVYVPEFRIKALHQGADSVDESQKTYDGDTAVLIDKDKINIQVHKIVPRCKKDELLTHMIQYVFAIYFPHTKVYFVKGE